MLTRKHYKAIAGTIYEQTLDVCKDGSESILVKSELVKALSDVFADDNPNFNRDKFKDACEVDGG